MDKIIPQSWKDKTLGSLLAWMSSFLIGISMIITMFGAAITYAVNVSANDIFDKMLLERGISKQTFGALQKDTAELKSDIGSIKNSINNINNSLTLQAQVNEHADKDIDEIKEQVNKLVDKLIQE